MAALALALSACSRGPGGPAPSPSSTDPSRPLPSPLPDVVARDQRPAGVTSSSIVPLAKPTLDQAQDREKARPVVLRAALDRYIGRELLFQEAVARGLKTTTRRSSRPTTRRASSIPTSRTGRTP